MNAPPPLPSSLSFVQRNAAVLKLFFIGLLGLLSLVLLRLVASTLEERLARHDKAVATITETWGKTQRLLGPVLMVPYLYKTESEEWVKGTDGKPVRAKILVPHNGVAYFLPEQLEIEGKIDPSRRQLGIYATHVYAAALKMQGRFAKPDFAFTALPNVEPQWDRATVGLAVADLRGTREALVLKWAGQEIAMQPGARLDGFGPGLHAPVNVPTDGAALDFAIELTLNGSGGLTFVPLGRQTKVNLASSWPAPGFHGAFLPVQREVGAQGFSALWQVSYYGRDFPQQWSPGAGPVPTAQTIEASAFGVNLVESVTAYRTIERAIKHGILFLTLVFVTFFLFETVSRVRLNALNYLLVAAALCLFYLGLLSLSEFIGFTPAYASAAGASLLLIGLYSRSILRSGRRAWLVSGMLGGVYGYLYFVLQLEDFSLLAGTAALFVVLAAVMFATRRIEANDATALAPAQS